MKKIYRVIVVDVKASKKFSAIEIKFDALYIEIDSELNLLLSSDFVLQTFIENYEKAFPESKNAYEKEIKNTKESKPKNGIASRKFPDLLALLKVVHLKCLKLEKEIEMVNDNYYGIKGIGHDDQFTVLDSSRDTELLEKYFRENKLMPAKLKKCSKEFFILYKALQKDYPKLYKKYSKMDSPTRKPN
jgi:hypothetical protein